MNGIFVDLHFRFLAQQTHGHLSSTCIFERKHTNAPFFYSFLAWKDKQISRTYRVCALGPPRLPCLKLSLASQLHDEHQKALLRRDFQLQSLGLQARLQQKLWSQERTLLVQESQHLKQALLLLSLKLRCFLKQWRLGCKKDTEWKDVLEVWVGGKETVSRLCYSSVSIYS